MVDTILFDLDGTLLDTSDDLTNCVNHILNVYGYPMVSKDMVIQHTGNAARYLLKKCIGEINEGRLDHILTEYKEYYAQHSCIQTKPYPGIKELIEKLQIAGFQIAIISNKPNAAAKSLGELFFPGVLTIGEEAGVPRKPNPAMLEGALRILHKNKAQTLYVGDSEVDILTAANMGIPCISVSWGFRKENVLIHSGATRIAHTAEELLDIIQTKFR